MKRKKIDSFTLFVILLLALILTLLGMLLAGMKEEKRQFTVLLPLGDLAYDEDFADIGGDRALRRDSSDAGACVPDGRVVFRVRGTRDQVCISGSGG